MGWDSQYLIANRVIIEGGNDGVFVYTGAPAAGTLVMAMAPAAGVDPYGNPYPQGFTVWLQGSGQTSFVQMQPQANQPSVFVQPNTGHYSVAGSFVGFEQANAGHTAGYAQMASPRVAGGAIAYAFCQSSSTDGLAYSQVRAAAQAYSPAHNTLTEGQVLLYPGWTTLTLNAGWTTFGAFAAPSYMMLSDSLFLLRGGLALSGGGALTTGTSPFTLPAGVRPADTCSYTCGATSAAQGQNVRLDIGANGVATVVFNQTGYSPTWFSIDQVLLNAG